jgi:hypothetical protein
MDIDYSRCRNKKETSNRQFDQWVSPWDRLMAVAAAASKKNPAQNGNVVIPADRDSALGTPGTRLYDGFMLRKTRDADVEETAKE